MPGQVRSALDRVTGAVKQFTLPQRVLAVIGVAVVLLGGVALSSWLAKPSMSPLFSSMSAQDASAVVDQLDADGVKYQLTDGGSTVLVPADNVYRLRLEMASAGLPANTGGDGYSLLDSMPMTSSEFQQQTTYQRALEGELAKTIGSMDGIEAASVKLALPKESVFVSEKTDPTASVFVRTKAGQSLGPDQVQAVVHLVSAGIQGMKATDVAVIDASGTVLSAVGAGATGGLSSQQAGEYEGRVRTAVQQLLDTVVGTGKSAVTVTADLDFDQTQRTSESFTAPTAVPPLASSTTNETYTGAGGSAAGMLGPDNIAVPGGASGTGTYSSTSEDVTNAVNKVTEVTTAAPGTVRRQSIAVAVDAGAAAGLDMTQLTTMLTAAAGIDAARGDTISVQRMAFDATAAQQAQDALAAADGQAAADRSAGLVRQAVLAGGIVLAVLLLVIVGWRRSRRARREALDIGDLALGGRDDETRALEGLPDSAVPVLGAAPEPAEPDPATLKRAEIAALVDEQPAEVADVLRAWLGAPGARAGRR